MIRLFAAVLAACAILGFGLAVTRPHHESQHRESWAGHRVAPFETSPPSSAALVILRGIDPPAGVLPLWPPPGTPTPTATPTPIPTPTPEPTAAPVYVAPEPAYEVAQVYYGDGVEQWRGLVASIMPAETVDMWLAIMDCESGGNPNTTGSAGEEGLLQIHPAYHADATYDPYGNVMAAYRISGGGYNTRPWSCARMLGY